MARRLGEGSKAPTLCQHRAAVVAQGDGNGGGNPTAIGYDCMLAGNVSLMTGENVKKGSREDSKLGKEERPTNYEENSINSVSD